MRGARCNICQHNSTGTQGSQRRVRAPGRLGCRIVTVSWGGAPVVRHRDVAISMNLVNTYRCRVLCDCLVLGQWTMHLGLILTSTMSIAFSRLLLYAPTIPYLSASLRHTRFPRKYLSCSHSHPSTTLHKSAV
jgi:hypothetical protein